jgi:NDP-sugar pyrophosphorylase family protein
VKAGIFAAGFGERLGGAARGPKGMTPVAGRPLVDWVLDDLDRAGVEEIVVIVNEQSSAMRDHVTREHPRLPIRWIVETTPSSMHSFFRVMGDLTRGGDAGPFLVSTVDTIAPPGTFGSFAARAAAVSGADVVLALTSHIDDEKPFRIRIGDGGGGSGIVEAMNEGPLATAGYSMVGAAVLREADPARAAGLCALREFFAHIFARGYRFAGVCMPDSVDVDRAADVAAAERLIRAVRGGAS